MKKAVLAYSGGLDTSVAIRWLQDNYGYDVIALVADVGQDEDLEAIRRKAHETGAAACHVVDAQDDLACNHLLPALRANALYEGKYPLASALSRPLIARLLVEVAHREGAEAVAHGCTGKGNDQVRFDVSVSALDPGLRVLAPVREWPMSRDEQIAYAKQHGIPVPVQKENPFSIDENLWGRSIECGVLEDPWIEPPEVAFKWTVSPQDAPDEPQCIEITFAEGAPTAIDGVSLEPTELIQRLNIIAGRHGVGRIDHVENRLVGIKSREIYEAPAASVLIAAHRDLEQLTLPRELAHYKQMLEPKYAELAYNGLWSSPLRQALDAFITETQRVVSGTVRVKLYRGTCTVTGRKSAHSLYDTSLATYGQDDGFSHDAAEGFIEVWGLPTTVYSRVNGGSRGEGKAAN